ncbi:ABC transporter ATP-binding protein [Haloarcula marismortui]|uniref:ABC-type D-xylose/L-arabinose transporter n=1 Tax=Haloarcula marismortui ATCC 33800 TaxID=662476 RepID=M0JTF5_9EURY|nr:ABC transporter ATP-binding protein [Haloarcula sinaiiensis]EMA11249.1 ABC transporter [Haloarcula sinaiiensis ATCC 33800]QUJ73780.1 ABC transporter ATP-binding protein [Haloarcula sinaiiensis ATCC 33800]
MAQINLDTVRKEFADDGRTIVAVDDLDLTIRDGEFLVLVGPSGCGKTTTLRSVAGLEEVTAGTITFDDEDVTDLRARDRNVAMVFQNYALYPHMNVRRNIGFGLRLSTDMPSKEIDQRVDDVAEMLGIEELLGKKPKALSGGQQQRVALGRAIVRDPEVFLMDEPLSNLDAKLRAQMRTELQELQHELDVTTVYVTHDQTEAMAMGDRIAIMNDGELQQVGTAEEVYRSPTNEFVANFIGSPSINLLTATVEGDTLKGPGGFSYQLSDSSPIDGYDRVRVGVRPEDMTLVEDGIAASVTVVEPMGNENFCYMEMGDVDLTARIDASLRPSPDETIQFGFEETALYLFDPETGESLKTMTNETDVSIENYVTRPET